MESPLPDHLKNIHILLADDDEFIRRIVRHILMGLGFEQIREVNSGNGVKDVLGTIPFEILISDVQMPGINGIELLRQIRCGQTDAPRDLPVIILTSFSNTEVLSASLALDVNGFLVKPMKPATVYAKITQALGERVQLRDVHAYLSVDTVLASLNEAQVTGRSSASITRPAARETLPGHAAEVRIHDLKPGMVLVGDILLTDGTLLLSARRALGEITINRLKEMQEVLKADTCWVARAGHSA